MTAFVDAVKSVICVSVDVDVPTKTFVTLVAGYDKVHLYAVDVFVAAKISVTSATPVSGSRKSEIYT